MRSRWKTPCASCARAAGRCRRPCRAAPARWPPSWASSPGGLEELCREVGEGEVVSPGQLQRAGADRRRGPRRRRGAGRRARRGREGPRHPAQGERPLPLRPHGAGGARGRERARAHRRAGPRLPDRRQLRRDAQPRTRRASRSCWCARSTDPCAGRQSVQLMAAHGVTHALEIGPGKVLAGLVKRIAQGREGPERRRRGVARSGRRRSSRERRQLKRRGLGRL